MEGNSTLYSDALSFGQRLVTTGDLDPVYVALHRMEMPDKKLAKWLIAYWCFYHAGLASQASEQTVTADFWSYLLHKAGTSGPTAPRASERRHFRGRFAEVVIESLRERYQNPHSIIRAWYRPTFTQMRDVVSDQYGFGPWITFKVADMFERVLGRTVLFNDCALDMYKEPAQGGALIITGDAKADISPDQLKRLCACLESDMRRRRLRPPGSPRRRKIGLQEVETVLCKYKGYHKGTYTVGHDIKHIRAATLGWGRTADTFRQAMPAEVMD